jgi:uncharacterized protein
MAAASVVSGCASARMSDHDSDGFFRRGQYAEAAASLRAGVEKEGENGRDLLLYLMDLGLTLHTEGKYEESNKVLLRAESIADIKDYTSLATEAGTLLVSENITDYKGEDFEKVLINVYLAMNYALIGNAEDALVEARKVNRKLHMMITEGQRKYKQNAFARYLSGILYEAEKDFGNAYIDYKMTYELMPDFPGLGRDLWRTAWLEGMREEMEKWDEVFGLKKEDHDIAKKVSPRGGNQPEIIVIYQNGISPIKRSNPDWRSLPKFYPRANPVRQAQVFVNGAVVGETHVLHDIETTAIENLDEKYGGMIAKKVAGVVAKEVVAHQIEKSTGNQGWGMLASLVLHAADQADVRSWNLLPRDLQVIRVPVEPGNHTVSVNPIGAAPSGEKTVSVKKGQKVFVTFRYIPN